MKKIYKYCALAAFSGLLLLSLPALAQHPNGGGGGGNNGGGGSRASAAPAPAPQQSAPRVQSAPQVQSRPAASQNYARPSNNNVQRPQQVRTYNNGNVRTYNTNGHATFNTNPRSGVRTYNTNGHTTVNSYRSYPSGSVYGHNHGSINIGVRAGFLPGHAYYHYNRGYYGSSYAPRLGFSVGFLPYGYYPFWYGDYQYYYSGGYYYQYANDEYTVVEPPVGAEIKSLPDNAQSIVINGQQYYEANGVYYVPITKDDGTLSYQVAGKDGELNTDDQTIDDGTNGPQMGDVIPQLPANCRKININGDKLYLSPDGIYYKAVLDKDNNKVYQIVGLPADNDQQQQDGN